MKKLLILFIAVAFISCKDDEEPISPWNAEHLATLISTDSNWEKEYKDANIVTETKFMDEFNAEKTIKTLYPETEDELVIIFDGDTAEQLYWFNSGQWTTPYGTVGDPITVLEKANGAGIQFYGLGYDLPGKVKIDKGNLVGKNITFAVRPTSDIIPTEYYSYNSFEAGSPKSKDLKLYITRVQMELPLKTDTNSAN